MPKSYLIDVKRTSLTLFSILWLLALASYQPLDPGIFHHVTPHPADNTIGLLGAYIADFTLSLFGYTSFALPVIILSATWVSWQMSDRKHAIVGACLLCLSITALFALLLVPSTYTPTGSGGMIGHYFIWPLLQGFGFVGTCITLTVILSVAVLMLLQMSWKEIWQKIRLRPKNVKNESTDTKILAKLYQVKKKTELSQLVAKKDNKVRKVTVADTPNQTTMDYQIALGLLQKSKQSTQSLSQDELNNLASCVEKKLADFGIKAAVKNVCPGPVITRFELSLAAGTKVSRLSSIVTDLARSLSVQRARVVEVIPGKSYVGLELPNPSREIVYLSETLEGGAYQKASSPLSLALGKDIAGYPVVVDLIKMPHLLVAGTTGSGKSVGLNTMLVSMLYKAPPSMLKLILIDPKMLELAVYADIPHLLAPVVTDMNDAAGALRWCVAEMEKRYQLMVAAGVRNIAGFNAKVSLALKQGKSLSQVSNGQNTAILDKIPLEPMPYIVVVADEFADMMMVVGKKVEQLIARLAQKARAAGIHLIFATQRPSVDVITGLIKANIPTRISFQVSSKIDSRTILDQGGAEQLLGHGDMLYQPPGTSVPIRIHGAFVSDDEVHAIVEACKKYGQPDYMINFKQDPLVSESDGHAEKDDLYDHAVNWVIENGKVSVSSLQRRFKIGYNRASCIVESMEKARLVSSPESSGLRRLLIQSEEK